MTMMMPVSSSWARPMATWLSVKKAGRGQPHIICPMDRYIRISRKPREVNKRRFSAGVSRSFSGSSCAVSFALPVPFRLAP